MLDTRLAVGDIGKCNTLLAKAPEPLPQKPLALRRTPERGV